MASVRGWLVASLIGAAKIRDKTGFGTTANYEVAAGRPTCARNCRAAVSAP